MKTQQIEKLVELLRSKGVMFELGLSEKETGDIEQKFNFRFPPDLKTFLQTNLPVSEKFPNWRLGLASRNIAKMIDERLAWPLEGILFDIEQNNFWIEDWGRKPDLLVEKIAIATKHFTSYPKLIPVFSHRYIPSEPNQEDNPILSVYQTDIIYYGFDLPSYFANEFHFELDNSFELLVGPKREIRFWSSLTA